MKTCLITGASKGIGAELAIQLSEQGYEVAINYKNDLNSAKNVLKKIHSNNNHAFLLEADISTLEGLKKIEQTLNKRWDSLDSLVLNAGVANDRNNFTDITLDELEQVMNTNFRSAFILLQYAIKRMRNQKNSGNIVAISTNATKTGGYRLTPYVASKAALKTLCQSLANEVGSDGIRINTVSPGIIETSQESLSDAAWRANAEKRIPLGRLGQSTEVSNLISWLLSDQASYITGADFPVTGGL
jgi:3-oxoacyl-[acyl-carrier protein] reductase